MRSSVVYAVASRSSRRSVVLERDKMKLPISLLVLAALGQAASPQATEKTSASKSTISKKTSNQTSKRELYEGNFGDRKELGVKYAVSGSTPKVEYADDLNKLISEQTSAHQIFGVRLPQIAKISDVLSGQGPSFEAAVAKHLYSPISVYQARLSSPTTFEVPAAAASQLAYPKPFKLSKGPANLQKIPEVALKGVDLINVPLYTVKQPKFRFEAYSQSEPSNQQASQQEIIRSQQLPKQSIPEYFPILTNDQLGPIRYQGNVLPPYLQQNRIYQLLPVNSGFAYSNQDGNSGKSFTNQDNREESKSEPTTRSLAHNAIPIPKQGYHSHPNGAISFASFSQNLPVIPQYESVPQSPPGNFNNQQLPIALPPQPQAVAIQLQTQQQKSDPLKQNPQYPPILNKIVQDLQKYQPDYHPHLLAFKQQIQNDPSALNSFQQNFLFQDPRQLPNLQPVQLQRLPAFKPLPQPQLTPESYFQQTSPSPTAAEPRPFSYDEHSTQTPSHVDQPLAPVFPQRQYTPLPPLKPNYNKNVKPLKQRAHATSVFLPTPSQPLPSSTPNIQHEPDQIISSTTIQPDVKDNEKENQDADGESETSQPLESENIPQSQQTVIPLSIQSTTYQPQVLHESRSEYSQPSTTDPDYDTQVSTIRPQSIKSAPRHEVVIQRQEVQELIFEPSPRTPSATLYNQQQNQIRNQPEQDVDQLQSQEHHQLLEQLQPLNYQQDQQDPQSQYRLEARQLQNPQRQYSIQQIEPTQYQIQPYSYPLQFYQFQAKPLQSQQNELKQSKQQQQEVEQTQSQQYQQYNLEPKNDAQSSTPKPEHFKPQESEKQSDQVENQNQQESDSQSQLQSTTEKPHEQTTDNLSESGPRFQHSYYGPLLSPLQSHFPQIFAQPQQLVAQPEYSSLLGGPTGYPEVQYFGKFAQALFGNGQH